MKTNIVGAENVVNASILQGVSRVVALSTDKAAAPINLYGATKLASDKIFVAANTHKGERDITFSVVRYGNVLGSRGSVVPFFREHSAHGYLPITDKRMTRFNISLQQGVDFVLDCLGRQWGGKLFVSEDPVVQRDRCGDGGGAQRRAEGGRIRPGEKLHEEMITSTDSMSTIEFEDYYVILPSFQVWDAEEFIQTSSAKPGKRCDSSFEYNSGTNEHFLSVDDIREMIEKEL